MNLQLFALRSYYGGLSFIAPKAAANKAFMLFQKVRIKAKRKREEDFFERAKKIQISNRSYDYQVYELGDPTGKPIVLVHGWDSNIGSLSHIAFALEKERYRVVAINLPAHGDSKQERTNMYECKNSVQEILNEYQFETPISFVTHSFGSGVAVYALSELNIPVDRMVFLTVAHQIIDIFTEFKEMINLGDRAFDLMLQKADEILGEPLDNLNTDKNLHQVDFNQGLIIHDKYDKVLPFDNALAIAAAVDNIEVKAFEKIGHYRMLWNDEVLKCTLDFLEG